MAWQTAIGGFTTEVLSDNDKRWVGDHLVDPAFVPGVLFTNTALRTESASQIDIVPTILDSLGVTADDDFDGQSLIR
jgi:bisphosphoglycerate-independent phosphoglycerate mutase (AlkP superfamily)